MLPHQETSLASLESPGTPALPAATLPATTTPLWTAGNAQQVLLGKILLVHIIEIAYDGNAAVFFEDRRVATGLVSLVCSITCEYSSKLAISHIGLGYDIDCFSGIAIIKTSKLGLVTQPVEDLDLVNDLGRQVS